MSIEFPGIKSTQFSHARDSDSSTTRRSAAPQTKAAAGDHVTLTGDAAQMARLTAAVNATPIVDIQRIEGVKRDIADGHYVPDPGRIAARLANFEGQLTQSLAA